ncbi:MAG TPA: PaaI family thioesterase [Acidimicrobiales bacterium]|nr:PaaI family thioesterase [Acidimicrobiales bacterium]
MRRLTNEDWGFSSNCFVCEPTNSAGLQMPFFVDDDAGVVRAELNLDNRFSGAPAYVHGGLTLAVMDEAGSWATIALAKQFAVTKETTTRFLRPIRVELTYRVEARVTSQVADALSTRVEVFDHKDRVCAETEASWVPLSPAHAHDAIGVEVEGPATEFLRRPPTP